MESLEAREVVIRGTRFKFGKLLAPEAFDVFNRIRPGLICLMPTARIIKVSVPSGADVTPEVGVPSGADVPPEVSVPLGGGVPPEEVAKVFIEVLSTLPDSVVATLRAGLFPVVTFQRANAPPARLAGNESIAFDGLDMLHIWEVIIRAAAVNFLESWLEMKSRYGSVLDTQSQTPLTSSPSSETSSPADTSPTPISTRGRKTATRDST